MPKIIDPPKDQKTKKTNGKKNGKKAEAKPILYERYETRLFSRDPAKAWLGEDGKPSLDGLTADVAKELLNWQVEAKEGEFGEDYLLLDTEGRKVRCLANLDNRPFYPQLAQDWKLEVLRRKWQMNGEPIIVGEQGNLHDGQHTLVGLVLATEEWESDRKLPPLEQKWRVLWPEQPYIEKLVVLGIKENDETVNTINTGKRRSYEDALYRSHWLKGKAQPDRIRLSKVCGSAIKLLWSRTKSDRSSLAPRRPHSESFAFLESHPKLMECVQFISDESKDNEKFTSIIQPGQAAALLYLMGSATSNLLKYEETNHESALEWKLYEKACKFFVDVAANGKATEPLREAILKIPAEAGGRYSSDLRIGLVIKAWNLYSDGEKITEDTVSLEEGVNDFGQPILLEKPTIGGIDAVAVVEEQPNLSPVQAAAQAEAVRGECPKGGDHEWKTEDKETFCNKCLEPAPKVSRKKAGLT